MSTQFEIFEAKDRFVELVARARSGEEIVLADGGTPVVRITQAQSGKSGASPVPEWKAALMQAAGMWKDRDDIPQLMKQLRTEWNRVEPLDERL